MNPARRGKHWWKPLTARALQVLGNLSCKGSWLPTVRAECCHGKLAGLCDWAFMVTGKSAGFCKGLDFGQLRPVDFLVSLLLEGKMRKPCSFQGPGRRNRPTPPPSSPSRALHRLTWVDPKGSLSGSCFNCITYTAL